MTGEHEEDVIYAQPAWAREPRITGYDRGRLTMAIGRFRLALMHVLAAYRSDDPAEVSLRCLHAAAEAERGIQAARIVEKRSRRGVLGKERR